MLRRTRRDSYIPPCIRTASICHHSSTHRHLPATLYCVCVVGFTLKPVAHWPSMIARRNFWRAPSDAVGTWGFDHRSPTSTVSSYFSHLFKSTTYHLCQHRSSRRVVSSFKLFSIARRYIGIAATCWSRNRHAIQAATEPHTQPPRLLRRT